MNDNLDMLGPSTRVFKEETNVIERDMTTQQFIDKEYENNNYSKKIEILNEHVKKYNKISQHLVIDQVQINAEDIKA